MCNIFVNCIFLCCNFGMYLKNIRYIIYFSYLNDSAVRVLIYMNYFTLYLLVTYYKSLLISHLPFFPQRLSCQTLAKTSSLIPMEMWTINRRCLSCHMTPVYGKMTILVLSYPKDLSSKMSQVSCIMVYEYPEW